MDKYFSNKIKIISFISILMVVYLHAINITIKYINKIPYADKLDINSFIQQTVTNGITRVAVPMFFSISGYLFFLNLSPTLKGFFTKYKKRVFSLLIPYFCWNMSTLLFYYSIQSIHFFKIFFTKELIANYSFNEILYVIFINPIAYQLWFMVELLKYMLICPILFITIKKVSYYSLVPFLVLWILNINLIVVRNEGILFFIFGSVLAIKKVDLKKSINSYLVIVVTFSWIIISFVNTFISFKGIFIFPYIQKISIIFGIISIWYLYDICFNESRENKVLEYTSFTFFIYAFHEPTLTIIKKVILRLTGISMYTNLFAYIISPILTIVLSILIAILLKKYATPLYRIITGGRIT